MVLCGDFGIHYVGEGDGVVLYQVLDFGEELVKDLWGGGDDVGLIAVAACEVLGGDDWYFVTGLGMYEQYFGMVVGEVCGLYNLTDETPQGEGLVGGLEI